jgi:hypothetical protein
MPLGFPILHRKERTLEKRVPFTLGLPIIIPESFDEQPFQKSSKTQSPVFLSVLTLLVLSLSLDVYAMQFNKDEPFEREQGTALGMDAMWLFSFAWHQYHFYGPLVPKILFSISYAAVSGKFA